MLRHLVAIGQSRIVGLADGHELKSGHRHKCAQLPDPQPPAVAIAAPCGDAADRAHQALFLQREIERGLVRVDDVFQHPDGLMVLIDVDRGDIVGRNISCRECISPLEHIETFYIELIYRLAHILYRPVASHRDPRHTLDDILYRVVDTGFERRHVVDQRVALRSDWLGHHMHLSQRYRLGGQVEIKITDGRQSDHARLSPVAEHPHLDSHAVARRVKRDRKRPVRLCHPASQLTAIPGSYADSHTRHRHTILVAHESPHPISRRMRHHRAAKQGRQQYQSHHSRFISNS